MKRLTKAAYEKKARLLTVFAVCLALAAPLFASGCGASTPQGAVQNLLGAIEKQDWNAYLSSILPENVRRMTDEEYSARKDAFKKTRETHQGMKLKTRFDKKDRNRADVEITAGKIKMVDPATKQSQTISVEELKKQNGRYPSLQAEKYRGRWYVDVPMASADTQQSMQPQQ